MTLRLGSRSGNCPLPMKNKMITKASIFYLPRSMSMEFFTQWANRRKPSGFFVSTPRMDDYSGRKVWAFRWLRFTKIPVGVFVAASFGRQVLQIGSHGGRFARHAGTVPHGHPLGDSLGRATLQSHAKATVSSALRYRCILPLTDSADSPVREALCPVSHRCCGRSQRPFGR